MTTTPTIRSDVRVLAQGWYGAGNVGDELLLQMAIDWCREAGATVSALSPFPRSTGLIHKLEAVDAFDFPAVAAYMRQSDLFLLGGGGLFQTHHAFTLPEAYDYVQGDIAGYARPVLMARQMGVPTLLWAQGVGPLDGDEPREIVRDLFSNADHASVRDAGSARLLEEIGVGQGIVAAPDPVWALPISRADRAGTNGKRRIGLVVREWASEPDWSEGLVRAVRSVIEPADLVLVWIPFQLREGGETTPDLSLVEDLVARLGEYEHEVVSLKAPGDAIAALRGCDTVVCMRLHAQIVAMKLGKPALCIEYDEKMGAVSEIAGLPASMRLLPSSPPEKWREGIAALLAADAYVVAEGRVAELHESAMSHKRVLHAAISDARSRPARSHWEGDGFDWIGTWAASTISRAFSQREAYLSEQVARRDGWLALAERKLSESNEALLRQKQTADGSSEALAAAEKAMFQQREALDRLAREVGDLRASAQASEQNVRALTAELARRDDLDVEHQRGIDSRVVAAEALMSEVATVRQERDAMRFERDRTAELLLRATSERDSLMSSLSWRLTQPLRVVRALLVLPGPQRRQLLRDLARSTYWALPEAIRVRVARLRQRLAGGRAAPAVVALAPVAGLDWVTLADSAEKVAVVPSAFEFDEFVNQRPINLAKYLASRGYTVIFAAWQWSRGESLAGSNREVYPGVWQVDLYALVDHVERLARRQDACSAYFITLPAPELVDLHQSMRRCGFAVVYDILDEWEAFSGVGQAPWYSAPHECEAVIAADVVVAVSPPLIAKFAHLRDDMRVVGNGYDPATIGAQRKFCAAGAVRAGARGRIGYFGHLTDAWFDWGIVFEAARRLPECEFEIIGYGEPSWAREVAACLPNITLIGKVPSSELWRYAQHWHVGLAPFKPGTLAQAIDPIKVYEYIYFGLPTVCTGIPHLASLPGVAVAVGVDEFVNACREKVERAPDYAEMERCLDSSTWKARFDAILDLAANAGLREMYVS